MIKQITIIGLGLIGGSIARALTAAQMKVNIVAYDKNIKHLQLAYSEKQITDIAKNISDAVVDADIIFIAVAPKQIKNVLQEVAKYRKKSAIITDVCSTKQKIVQQAKTILKKDSKYFVPAHPIAGSEKTGWKAAQDNLFQYCTVVLTPIPSTSPKAVKIIKQLWQKMGATVLQLTPEKHDKILAITSHLPQILAYLYFNTVFKNKKIPNLPEFTGSGFRDFTRLAASPAELWLDITSENQQAILQSLNEFKKYLNQFEKLLKQKNQRQIFKLFQQANRGKKTLFK